MRISNPIAHSLIAAWRLPSARRNRPGWIARLVTAAMRVREQARERRQLLRMTPRELRDIGLTTVDAWREANKPLFWKE